MNKQEKVTCPVCMHACRLSEGQRGRCRARVCRDGRVVSENYGRLTSLALDPIEKKPLNRFYPGSKILSAGSYGCSLSCAYCQNDSISQAGEREVPWREVSPEELCALAKDLAEEGNIGAAFTYNEPLVSWEYVRDCGRLLQEAGMKTVLVTNGSVRLPVLDEVLPYVDAMNVDLKAFRAETYKKVLGGDLDTVLAFLEAAAGRTHLEVTYLAVPGLNDSEEEARQAFAFLAGLDGGRGKEIPLHISRFFPRYRMRDRGPTPVRTVLGLCGIAREYLTYVYPGNI